jgi:hypothetical protein
MRFAAAGGNEMLDFSRRPDSDHVRSTEPAGRISELTNFNDVFSKPQSLDSDMSYVLPTPSAIVNYMASNMAHGKEIQQKSRLKPQNNAGADFPQGRLHYVD